MDGKRRSALSSSWAWLVVTAALSGTAYAQTINVSNVSQLHNAVNTANSNGGNTTILLADGTYSLNDTLYVNASNVTIAGQSGDRTKVVIQGDAMSSSASIGNLIRVAGQHFTLHDVTLQKSGWHLIQIVGEENADSPIIRDCILRDAYEQMIKVSAIADNPVTTGDNGLVENCLFEYTAGIAPQYYVGGIDAHGAKNWTIRGNTFRSIVSPNTSVAEFAVHFWNTSANNVVEQNVIINCDRGIGFGLDGRGNTGGIIRNNMIYHAANVGQFADTGIALTESPNTQVYNNTIYLEHNFPWAIEYRYSQTTGVQITNNLTNKTIQSRDGASASLSNNITSASAGWFVDVSAGDLHLRSSVSSVVDKGSSVSGLIDDLDGQGRPQGSGIDIGADEYTLAASVAPAAPTSLQVE